MHARVCMDMNNYVSQVFYNNNNNKHECMTSYTLSNVSKWGVVWYLPISHRRSILQKEQKILLKQYNYYVWPCFQKYYDTKSL